MIIIKPTEITGSPSLERILSFNKYFISTRRNVSLVSSKNLGFFKLFKLIKDEEIVFISMPSFRKWWIFLVPGIKVIFDIRDGWSVAMDSGYGGCVKRNPVKAFFARKIEKWAIKKSYFTITCTPGLKSYLENVSGRSVHLIPNGVSNSDFEIATKYKRFKGNLKNRSMLEPVILCCAGKFSEYGTEKVKGIVSMISTRYYDSDYIIKLFGSNRLENEWVVDYVNVLSKGRGRVEILDRLSKSELYKKMAECDVGVSVVRDPDYELGTKVFDYIALGLPILNYFYQPNPFTDYFNNYLDAPFDRPLCQISVLRSEQIESVLSRIFNA